ncbi:MAG TPA: glycosyltransferase family 39 protein [Novosphingobium sp.]|nr:glycosyltransferase family 39 protein [Novosphingobium sp.]
MNPPHMAASRFKLDTAALIWSLAVFAVHAAFAGRYDLFRDELYFIVCGQHPAFGYADQPPLVPLMAAGLHALGHGAWLVRIPAVLAAGLLVYVTIRLVRLLGGGTLAVVMAALAAATAPILMGLSAILGTSGFDPLAWTAIALMLVRAIRHDDNRALIWAGVIAGLDLQIKYSLLLWAVGLAVGIVATPQRALLRRSALWIGLGLGAAIALPSFIWQLRNGLPFLELSAAAASKNADTALMPFILNQIVILNPLFAPIWIAGLVAPFAVARLKDLRFLAIAYLVTFAVVRLGHGKDYYLAACYPALFAIGAVALAPLAKGLVRKAGFALVGALAVAVSALAAPLALPILSPPRLVAYMGQIGFVPQQQEKSFAGTALPQLFADQLGWHDFTRQVVGAWRRIPADEQAGTAVLVENYGEAAALDIYGAPQGLPPALSGHNQYHLWGLRGQGPTNLLVIESDPEDLKSFCKDVIVLDSTASPYAMVHENGKAIAFCRGLHPPLAQLWPSLKHMQ